MYNGKAESGSAGCTGARFIYAIEALEYVLLRVLRDPDAGVSNGYDNVILVQTGRNVQFSPILIVFDAVFDQIEENLIYIVFRCQYC